MNSLDPGPAARRLLSRAEEALLDEALALAVRGGAAALVAARDNLQQKAMSTMSMLAKLPHDAAQAIARVYRGIYGRRMTAGELAAVREAYPSGPINWGTVRIVNGAGLSAVAASAFLHGNPAITLGDTIYLKPGWRAINYADLSRTEVGRELVVHESTHVIQYAVLGYPLFGLKYAADLARVRGDADKLYDYRHRGSDFAFETLEGQAEMVGNYGRFRNATSPLGRAIAGNAGRKLAGTGIYGR